MTMTCIRQCVALRRYQIPLLIMCGLLTNVKPSPAREHVALQLKWHHQFQFAGYYAALEKGFYREVGLDVTILEGGAFDTVDNVLSSRADYGVATTELLLHRLQGQPVVVLAAIFSIPLAPS